MRRHGFRYAVGMLLAGLSWSAPFDDHPPRFLMPRHTPAHGVRPIDGWEMVRDDDPLCARPDYRAPRAELYRPGAGWDGIGAAVWFRTTVRIPAEWAGPVVLRAGVDDRGEIYVDGVLRARFLWDRGEVVLDTGPARPGRSFFVALRGINTAGAGRFLGAVLARPASADRAAAAAALAQDVRLLASAHPEHAPALRSAVDLLDWRALDRCDFATFDRSLDQARDAVRASATPLEPHRFTTWLIPQSHLDMAWLWRATDTPAKCAETFGRATDLMDLFGDYVFTQSQAQAHAWTEERHPELFARIRARAAEGRWCPAGGMWVESDALMPGGESLVRQFLYGRTYFRERLGTVSPVVWLPDTFGFPATLPRIAAGCGMRAFYTVRVPDGFPHHFYRWRCGTDELLCAAPRTTYAYALRADTLFADPRNVLRATGLPIAVSPIGPGDGGGGPDRTQLDDVERLRARPAMPRLPYATADTVFASLEQHRDRLPVVEGELIVPGFSGTWSSQAAIKRLHRRCETALLEAETWTAFLGASDAAMRERLHTCWRTLLFNQFHDILCGTSIAAVHDDAVADLTRTLHEAQAVRDELLARLGARIVIPSEHPGTPILVCNPMAWHRVDPVEVAGFFGADSTDVRHEWAAIAPDGTIAPAQRSGSAILFIASVPPCGYAVYRLVSATTASRTAAADSASGRISNGLLSVRYDPRSGSLREVRDEVAGGVLARGAVDRLLLCRDVPAYYDSAWALGEDVARDPGRRIPAYRPPSVVEHGPVRTSVRTVHRTRTSAFTRTVSLYRGIEAVFFETIADWNERDLVLKTAFSPATLSEIWIAETAFGTVVRSFPGDERPVHRWTAVPGTIGTPGMLLLNDASYACDARDGTLRLTLCRTPVYPDPRCDRGAHRFGYALAPFRDPVSADRIARAFNAPLAALLIRRAATTTSGAPALPLPPEHSFLRVEPANVIVETVKVAHGGEGIIVRLREAAGHPTTAILRCAFGIAAAERVSLTEEDPVALPLGGATVAVPLAAHGLATVRLR